MPKKPPKISGIDDQIYESAYIVQPVVRNALHMRDTEDVIEEIEGLARAIFLNVAKTRIVSYSKIQAGSFFGKGIREDIGRDIVELEPRLVIVNHQLSPVQQRNLEKEWNTKVIDRTGLILEIFGERAQTKEGRLQVDLAALEYQRSRLVRSWTHLERQRGGAGFMGGPGERQIELDRRIISQKITKLKKELEDVRRTRDLGRKSRERVPFPIVSLVGYTNAGKSTLFNRITKAGVFAEDLPFATLDPTMRKITLPNHQVAILSDTVGFIADLPTHLVASFRATLEQVTHADVIVHVIDVSRRDYLAQKQDVISILKDMAIDYESDPRVIEVFNKADLLEDDDFQLVEARKESTVSCVCISALTGAGLDDFLTAVLHVLSQNRQQAIFDIRPEDGKALSWLYEHSDVQNREDQETTIRVHVSMDPADYKRFQQRFEYEESEAELRGS